MEQNRSSHSIHSLSRHRWKPLSPRAPCRPRRRVVSPWQQFSKATLHVTSYSDLERHLRAMGLLGQVRDEDRKIQQFTAVDTSRPDPEKEAITTMMTMIPSSIRLDLDTSHMLDAVMERAMAHWCCIGFKVAPMPLAFVRNWRRAPAPILYSIAAISLVSLSESTVCNVHDRKTIQTAPFTKDVAMELYQRARRLVDDILFENTLDPVVIQCYFCLSYTSNLLRLYEQQRTWAGLAAIALRQRSTVLFKQENDSMNGQDELTLLCWYRWYYIDAWMCLVSDRDCLLPDDPPPPPLPRNTLAYSQDDETEFNREHLYSFAVLARYMRRFIRAIHSHALFDRNNQPSAVFYRIDYELNAWYDTLPPAEKLRPAFKARQNSPSPTFSPPHDIHLYLCYHAMRLVVLFQFLQGTPPERTMVDSLETNVLILQGLQHLKDIGCDQSTYHHMFLAIHSTARRVYSLTFLSKAYEKLRGYAINQLHMNLTLLRSTLAYVNDTFKLRLHAAKCQEEIDQLNILGTGSAMFVFKTNAARSTKKQKPRTKRSDKDMQELPPVSLYNERNL
ncbi:hypothetical protein BCR43DRAFT_498556 [Syncephalastrum racemosum]|uniref:Transcription factor domain-containing protein n=1 Tax=Syncephalastrum racemosum TaxID=13706 RepID=A0A1X2H292_SYNRA|nr:hypothetical protein BCR43DRAFT_498556 [Syncephalastrum racemosum]